MVYPHNRTAILSFLLLFLIVITLVIIIAIAWRFASRRYAISLPGMDERVA